MTWNCKHSGREADAFREGGERLVREADQWRGSEGTGRFPQHPATLVPR
jgi:hypothetical protein